MSVIEITDMEGGALGWIPWNEMRAEMHEQCCRRGRGARYTKRLLNPPTNNAHCDNSPTFLYMEEEMRLARPIEIHRNNSAKSESSCNYLERMLDKRLYL